MVVGSLKNSLKSPLHLLIISNIPLYPFKTPNMHFFVHVVEVEVEVEV